MRRLYTASVSLVLVAGLALAALATLRLANARLEANVYRARLLALGDDYEVLRERYASLVRETAVTELLVEDGALAVSIRTAEGELQRIETPYDPTAEIYVDYVVRSGRLWIRRVFDAATPPEQGTVIDSSLAELDWEEDPELAYGKATYRALGEGRWIVTATGNGALGLAEAPRGTAVPLSPPPELRRYPPAPEEARDVLRTLGPLELARAAFDWLSGNDAPQG
jgi:hypothetical protein